MRNFFVSIGAGVALLLTNLPLRAGEAGVTTTTTTTRHKSWTEYTESSESRDFTLDRAVLTALKQNPDILRAIQEIERSKGVIIQIRAAALPQVTATGNGSWTDPTLGSGGDSPARRSAVEEAAAVVAAAALRLEARGPTISASSVSR